MKWGDILGVLQVQRTIVVIFIMRLRVFEPWMPSCCTRAVSQVSPSVRCPVPPGFEPGASSSGVRGMAAERRDLSGIHISGGIGRDTGIGKARGRRTARGRGRGRGRGMGRGQRRGREAVVVGAVALLAQAFGLGPETRTFHMSSIVLWCVHRSMLSRKSRPATHETIRAVMRLGSWTSSGGSSLSASETC